MNISSLSPRFAGQQIVIGTPKELAKLKTDLAKKGAAATPPVATDVVEVKPAHLAALKASLGVDSSKGQSLLQLAGTYFNTNPKLVTALETLAADTLGAGITRKTDLANLSAATVVTGEDAVSYQKIKAQDEKLMTALLELSNDLTAATKNLDLASTKRNAKEQIQAALLGVAFQSFGKLAAQGIVNPSAIDNIAALQEDADVQEKFGAVMMTIMLPSDTATRQAAINDLLDAVLPQIAATPEMAEAIKFNLSALIPSALEIFNVTQDPTALGDILGKLPLPTTPKAVTAAVAKTGLVPEAGKPLTPNRTIKFDLGSMLSVVGHIAAAAKDNKDALAGLAGQAASHPFAQQALGQVSKAGIPMNPLSNLLSGGNVNLFKGDLSE